MSKDVNWNALLNWQLLRGSHNFPGPDGGTCINEAAVVASGFSYRSIRSWEDCPVCFSPVIASYTMALNDEIKSDDLRQSLLLPFVVRMAGTADVFPVEWLRASYIATSARDIRRRFPQRSIVMLDPPTLEPLVDQVADSHLRLASNSYATWRCCYGNASASLMYAKGGYLPSPASHLASVAAAAVASLMARRDDYDEIFHQAVLILEGALAIGNQSDPVEVATVCDRMQQGKQMERV
jgi:hypothetical protein